MKKPFQRKSFYSWKNLDPSGVQGVFYEEAFHFVLKRERSRVDRSGGCFSLVVFQLPACRGKCSEAWILNVLTRRIRITDTIGWLNASSLAVLLQDTPAEGARAFLQQVVTVISDAGSVPDTHVHTYPENDGTGGFFAETLAVSPSPFPHLLERFAAGLALVFLSPLFLLIALVIKISSPGPVFFRQVRVGHKERTFYCNKFRTMRMHAETESHEDYFSYLMKTSVPMKKLDNNGDTRIFPVGRLLRASSLDELPQLINIFRGEMRLIGPRPCTPHEFALYLPWHRHRTDALPGLTGLWQVSGKNRTTFTQMIRLDLQYIKRQSAALDFFIILKTAPVVIGQFLEERLVKKS